MQCLQSRKVEFLQDKALTWFIYLQSSGTVWQALETGRIESYMMDFTDLVHQGEFAHKPIFPTRHSSDNTSQGTASGRGRKACFGPKKVILKAASSF